MWLLKVTLLHVAGCVALCSANYLVPIVNGDEATKGEYPWQILLKYRGRFTCGGSLIQDDVVLTGAHCVDGDRHQRFGHFSIVAGEHNLAENEGTEEEIRVDSISMHEGYHPMTLDNDIALLFLSSPVTLSASTATVPLLADDVLDDEGLASDNVWVSGWGVWHFWSRAIPNILQELNTSIITNQLCNSKLRWYGLSVTDDMVCTLNRNAGVCNGDSGGPMGFYNSDNEFVQVGIVSWGPSSRCANGRQVFTRVSSYRDWIDSKLTPLV